jgi:hypothetical protein
MPSGFTRKIQQKKDAVSVFLKGRPGLPFCDDCLRKTLHISRSNLPERGMVENAAAIGLTRKQGVCIVCGRERITTTA